MTERHEPVTEHGPHARRVEDPAGRPTPYVEGPTGPAPISSELRGDPGEHGDLRAEAGAVAGAVAGTGAAGPLGGMVGAVAGGLAGTAAEAAADDEATTDEAVSQEPGTERVVTGEWPGAEGDPTVPRADR